MKRTALIRHLTAEGCRLKREGANHSIWENPATNEIEAVPRHREISNVIALSICRGLSVPPPSG